MVMASSSHPDPNPSGANLPSPEEHDALFDEYVQATSLYLSSSTQPKISGSRKIHPI
ncbi:UNVERIFIED_CONTAM: hypothetical protein Sradi_0649100 [Sesamum radiatum]|uniref:Uncharacterized protein n=1 Tax=Sesamum radiatum TaxID=300843 RepID=A0AAW2VP58_SESRA